MHYWFKAKRYGYGWYPASWEGWLIMLMWLVAFARAAFFFVERMQASGSAYELVWFLPIEFGLTALLIIIAWLTGEPARWRWDDDKK